MAQRILVGADGSGDSRHAIEWCSEFARNPGVHIVVCHVVTTFSEWMLSVGQVNFRDIEDEHRRLLSGPWTEPLRRAGVSYEVVQETGDVVKTLLQAAEDNDVDLIVIGKAGHGAAGELLLGGTAARLAHRTTRPLLLVPARRAEHRPGDDAAERHVPLPG